MSRSIKLRFSPCPNDTFIFSAVAGRMVDLEGTGFDIRLMDIETLNETAFRGRADMIKVSCHAWMYLQDHYELLPSGSAMGYGNGPLLVSKNPVVPEEVPGMEIALPGQYTTAHLLFRYAFPGARRKRFMVFSEIERAVLAGKADAGVIIHEGRFTYENKGLLKILDLGEFWERSTGSPVPLGGIVARKDLGKEMIAKLDRILQRSVRFALENPDKVMEYVRRYAQEMEEEVMLKHIRLYVNEFTLDRGEAGNRALATLKEILENTESTE